MAHRLRLECDAAAKDWLSAELWESGTTGITETALPDGSWRIDAFFEERVDASCFEAYGPVWDEVEARDWSEAWKDAWTPLAVGRSWFLVPDWLDTPAPPERRRLVIHARQASGSGYQPATQLALEALEDAVRAGDRFLDWGTGSGILSNAAHLLGAGAIVACDIDPDAAVEAQANFAADAVPARLFVGTGRALASGQFDVIAANMNAAALTACAADLVRVAAPGARLVLSGFKQQRAADVAAAVGFPVTHEYASGDWRCLVRAAPPTSPRSS